MLHGVKLKDNKIRKWMDKASTVLRQGEFITLVVCVSGMRPTIDGMIVTNMRVMSAWMGDLPTKGPLITVELRDITRMEVREKLTGPFLLLTERGSREVSLGRLEQADVEMVRNHLRSIATWALTVDPSEAQDASGATTRVPHPAGPHDRTPPQPTEPPPGFVTYGSQQSPEPAFDTSRPPNPGDPVPSDCVWASVRHPGHMPTRATFGNLAKRMRVMGDPTGRTKGEIIAALGAPDSRSSVGADGGFLLQWQQTSNYSYNSHFALLFDRYGVCAGITHRWASL